LVAIRPFVLEKKRFAQKFTDGRTDDGRRAIVLAHSWNELIKRCQIIIIIIIIIRIVYYAKGSPFIFNTCKKTQTLCTI